MLDRATDERREGRGSTNVEFHKATIDKLPLADASVDCVISNCVINLAPDKRAVFREIARVLKPGGRVAVSDIALKKPLPPEIGQDLLAYVGCIAGAIPIEEYREGLKDGGLRPRRNHRLRGGPERLRPDRGPGRVLRRRDGERAEPVSIGAASCCTPAPAGSSACCTPQARRHRRSLLHDRGEGGGERAGASCCSGRVEDARAHHAARRARPPLRPQRLRGEREGLRRQAFEHP